MREAWERDERGDRCEEEVLWLEIAMADVVDGVAIFQSSTQHASDLMIVAAS
jgi:hypothetical protein